MMSRSVRFAAPARQAMISSRTRPWSRLALSLAVSASAMSIAASALAQEPIPPPQHSAVDANGVDLISGSMSVRQFVNSIGPNGPGGLAESFSYGSGYSIPSMFSYVSLSADGMTATVSLMGRSQVFPGSLGGGPILSEGASLDQDATNIIYALADGTVARFKKVQINYSRPLPVRGELKSVRFPTGETLTFTGDAYGGSMTVESSLGYYMAGANAAREWDAIAANLIQGGCTDATCSGPTYANQQALGRSLTKTGGSTVTITNPAGGAARTYTLGGIIGDQVNVTSVSDGAGTWTYSYTQTQDQTFHPDDWLMVMTATDPFGNKRIVKSRQSTQKVVSDTVGIKPDGTGGKTTLFQYDNDSRVPGTGRLVKVIAPEGDAVVYTYDLYSNVTEKRSEPKPGSGLAATAITASYNTALCASIGVCNRPDWIKDARGNQTDFTYDPVHGGVATVTRPATSYGKRPQTRYTYGQFTARYYRGGSLVAAPPVWRVTKTSSCMTGEAPACLGTSDETVTEYTYENSAVANNVRLVSTTTRTGNLSGTGALSSTTTYAYNDRGDVIFVDGPLAGTADVTRTYYDASRWKIGEIGPDPDGGGALLYRASRTTYAADGLVTLSETGTATSQSDAAMSSFSPLAFTRNTYGPTRQLIKVEAGQP